MGFNLTIVELKCKANVRKLNAKLGFNLTIVELK